MSDRIIVTSQTEMDKVPQGYDGIVEVRSNPDIWITVPNGLCVRVHDTSRVRVYGSSRAIAYDFSQIWADDSSQIFAYDFAQVVAYDSSEVVACDSAGVVAYDSARVWVYDSARVAACDSARVVAYDSSEVMVYDSALVVAYDSSEVVACGNAQVLRLSDRTNLSVTGNARIVEPPKTPREYVDYYGIEVRGGAAILYKVVDADLRAFYDAQTQYVVGERMTHECDQSRDVDCSFGLHVATKDWAIRFGMEHSWAIRFGMEHSSDFRLLEVAVPLDKIIVPKNTDGKVRTSELTVLREVPREEWDFYSTWRM